MMDKCYRGYILCRLSRIGTEWQLTDKIMELKGDSWEITYCTPIYGAWDLIVEVSFEKLEDLDVVVTRLRSEPDIREKVEETTTLVSSKPNYIRKA
jgi:DNA-binding Lrp family transcriptional regulator